MTRFIIITLSLLFIWQMICLIFNMPPYILPSPYLVLLSIKNNWNRKALNDDNKFLSEQEKIDTSESQVNQ